MPDWTRRLLTKLRPAPEAAPEPVLAPGMDWLGWPWPLLHPDRNLVVSWSAKAGCTPTLIWFFQQLGVLETALAHHRFVHNWRNEVYHKSPAYRARRADLAQSGGAGYTLLRVVRDPDRRLVSSFRHAVKFPLLDDLAHEKLGLDLTKSGLSLRNLERLLADEDLGSGRIDLHLRPQRHPVWKMGFDRVITLNMDRTGLTEGLAAVEADLDLPRTDFDLLEVAWRDDSRRYARDEPYQGAVPLEDFRFRRRKNAGFPKAQFLALPLLQDLARRHYGGDYPDIASADSAGRLFG